MEGWIVVMVSGLVIVFLLKFSGQVLMFIESLCWLCGCVVLVDIVFIGGGNIVVVMVDGSSVLLVQFYKVCVSVVSEKCCIDMEILFFLFMCCIIDLNCKDKFFVIIYFKFLVWDMLEQVFLCVFSQISSIVECWFLCKEGFFVNNIFQQIFFVVGDKQFMIFKWWILLVINDLDCVLVVVLFKLFILFINIDFKVVSDMQFYFGFGLVLVFYDGSVYIVYWFLLQIMVVFYSFVVLRFVDELVIKCFCIVGFVVYFKVMQFFWILLVLVGIDNQGKLSVFCFLFFMGYLLEVGLVLWYLFFLLEYCMVIGYDWWDILLYVQFSMVQSLVEKLYEEYMCQIVVLQQVFFIWILVMKVLFCKLLFCMVICVCDYYIKFFFIVISFILKLLLCFYFFNMFDKSFGDWLIEICVKIIDVDIDKVMINFKMEEFVLDMNILQVLQQFLQWVGDFVFYLLVSLFNQGLLLRLGYSFLWDGILLGMFWELMVVICIWGLLKFSCLFVYMVILDIQDSMFLFFCLFIKFWICCCDEGLVSELDEVLVDECCLLFSQLFIFILDWLFVSDGLVSCLQFKQFLCLQFGWVFILFGSVVILQFDGFVRVLGQFKIDYLWRLYFGVCFMEECKVCIRCGCVIMFKLFNRIIVVKQWEQCWIKNCLCGGLWWWVFFSYF